jgi:hypothetical protein
MSKKLEDLFREEVYQRRQLQRGHSGRSFRVVLLIAGMAIGFI